VSAGGQFDAINNVYEPNENAVNVGRIVDDLTPFVDRNLAGQVRLEGNAYDPLQIAVIGSASLLVRRRTPRFRNRPSSHFQRYTLSRSAKFKIY
jgi:hypothetical protein